MCSRYTLTKKQESILHAYNVKMPEFVPNYNLAPTQEGLVITADEPGIAQKMHFGLVPYWAADTKLNLSTLNARSEELPDKKTFAPLLQKHKTCLVLADGFYEWDKKSGKPLPYYFSLNNRDVFAFAGLWSQWKNAAGTQIYRSFTILTTQANELVGKIHAPKLRMPVILDRNAEKLWLNKELSAKDLLQLCLPYADEQMEAHKVSTDVNSTVFKGLVNNKSELILPVTTQATPIQLTLY
ncbi:SOS response-associated peptidase [Pedobacter sp.]|uniref:SOS response-associated peptidase n=1 Tax=Pedobacter sp. TaxID=1411316 RepID=UPI003D7F9123